MWLLDTNVLSEVRKPKPEPKVLAFIAGHPLQQFYISVVTLAEIRFGIESIDDPIRRAGLNDWLMQTVRPMFDKRVLPVTEEIMLRWRIVLEDGRKSGPGSRGRPTSFRFFCLHRLNQPNYLRSIDLRTALGLSLVSGPGGSAVSGSGVRGQQCYRQRGNKEQGRLQRGSSGL